MSKVILAHPGCVKYEHELKCKELLKKIFSNTELTKFDYGEERFNPIRADVDGVILYTHGRMITEEAKKRVIALCYKHNIPLYVPCVHELFSGETCLWTIKKVKRFQKGVTTLEQMNDVNITAMVQTDLIPCMTLLV